MVKALAGIVAPYTAGLFVEAAPEVAVALFAAVMLVGALSAAVLPTETRGQELADDFLVDGGPGEDEGDHDDHGQVPVRPY